MKKASISETKSNLSKYIRYVSKGHRVEILDRGKPVAYLVKPSIAPPALSALIAEGVVQARTHALDWLCEEPAQALPELNLSGALSDDREELI